MGEDFTTNVDCGGIASGTEIDSSDTLQGIIKNMIWEPQPPAPPTEYESKNIGTWSSANDVDTFFTTHTAWNGWAGLKLGNIITIQDGTYNAEWQIAGFNCEHNQTAADGTTYDNGYGICMIPKGIAKLTTTYWHPNADTGAPCSYIRSDIHEIFLAQTVMDRLKPILGNHIVMRNMLLGCRQNLRDSLHTYEYRWTTGYASLMSVCQLTGNFASYTSKYDDGEANYKLPLFDHENYASYDYGTWTRNVYGNSSGSLAAYATGTSGVGPNGVYGSGVARPLIYLR